jgi:Zn finger protein HypA/HybF involved in hydrogenase expression
MAAIEFTREEFAEHARANIGEPDPEELEAVFSALQAAHGGRQVNEALEAANTFLDGSGVEALFGRDGQVVTDPWDSVHLLEYVNVDTYITTLLYDVQRRTFYLGNWGDFVEAWEAEWEAERHPTEDVCVQCGQQFPVEQLTYDDDGQGAVCRECDQEHRTPPTWEPGKTERLIAMLRSVEGFPVAVHMIDYDELRLAFSVPMTAIYDDFKHQTDFIAQSTQAPYSLKWPSLVEAFRRQDDLYVASTNPPNMNVGIERDQFQRLAVAMDSFMEHGMERQAKMFLETPPVLWRCEQISHVQWHEERGEAWVHAYVGDYREAGALSVWSARNPEVESLIEDGFISWKNDDSVRKYLQEIGLCR